MVAKPLDENQQALAADASELERLFRQRLKLVQAAGATKTRPDQVPAPARVEAVIANVRSAAVDAHLDPRSVERAYRTIVALFIEHEATALRSRPAGQASPDGSGQTLDELRVLIDELDRQLVREAATGAAGHPDGAADLLIAAARTALA